MLRKNEERARVGRRANLTKERTRAGREKEREQEEKKNASQQKERTRAGRLANLTKGVPDEISANGRRIILSLDLAGTINGQLVHLLCRCDHRGG